MRPILAALCLALPLPAAAEEYVTERLAGNILGADGGQIGSVSVAQTESGVTLVTVMAIELESGTHGVHLHETGRCEGDFSSAGGHIAGDADHGLVEGGPHPGDLPNGYVGDDGELSYQAFALQSLDPETHLMDADGSALIIHSGADDYVSQPSGAAGSRVGCAVLDMIPAAEEVLETE